MRDQYGVKIPANIDDVEDRIIGPFTARQVAILAGTGAALWLAFMATRELLPLPVLAAAAAPIVSAAFAVAVVRRDGLPLERLAVAAIRQRLAGRRLVPAPEGVQPPPSIVGAELAQAARPPAPLRLPVAAVREDGAIDLGTDGHAVIVTCSTVSFALATPAEQEAMVAAFARCLNSLASPIQVVVRAQRVDISAHLDRLHCDAPALPHPALERAAREHAAYLSELARSADLLRRQVLLVVREATPSARGGTGSSDGGHLRRHAEQLARSLAAAGITATVLPGSAAQALLTAVCDPNGDR